MEALFEVLQPGDPDYELARLIDPQRLPAHIAIIMDGNGRWAKQRNLPRVAGHRAGIESVRVTVETCARLGIQVLTLYAFSLENWKRPQSEVETLWQLLHHYVDRELPTLSRHRVRVQVIGRIHGLPEQVRQDLQKVLDATRNNEGLLVNFAMNYGGRAEIVDAVNRLLDEARREGRLAELRVDEKAIASHLYTAGLPDPDLLIRTSGEMRVSNFLLWQIAYTELYITPVLWPDFRRRDLLEAIVDFQRRERRFGGLKETNLEPAHSDASDSLGICAH